MSPSIQNRIAVLRAERGLSRQQLADALDINVQTVGYLERGDYNPSLELAFRIAEHFGLPLEAVFSRQPFAPAPQHPASVRRRTAETWRAGSRHHRRLAGAASPGPHW